MTLAVAAIIAGCSDDTTDDRSQTLVEPTNREADHPTLDSIDRQLDSSTSRLAKAAAALVAEDFAMARVHLISAEYHSYRVLRLAKKLTDNEFRSDLVLASELNLRLNDTYSDIVDALETGDQAEFSRLNKVRRRIDHAKEKLAQEIGVSRPQE